MRRSLLKLVNLILVFSLSLGAATGNQSYPGNDFEGLDEAFAALQDFANNAENEKTPVAANLDEVINQNIKQLDESAVPLDSMKEEVSADLLKQVSSLSTQEILDEDLRVDPAIVPAILLLGGIKTTKKIVRNVIERLLVPSDIKRLNVAISGSPIPRVGITPVDTTKVEMEQIEENIERVEALKKDGLKRDSSQISYLQTLRERYHELQKKGPNVVLNMEVTVGLLALVKNVDELAGVIAQAMSRFNPEVYGLSDDPRIYRNLEAIGGFKTLEPKFQEIIKADAGTTERLVAAGFNPWSVYNFETNIIDSLNEKFVKNNKFAPVKFLGSKELEAALKDDLRPVRMQAIKAYIADLSKRKDILENVSHDEKFSSGFRFLQYRLKIYTQSFFSKLTFAVPVAGTVIAVSSVETLYDAISSVYVTTVGLIPEGFWTSGKETIGGTVVAAQEGAQQIMGRVGESVPSMDFEFPDLSPLVDIPQKAFNQVIQFTDPTEFLQKYCNYIVPIKSFVADLPSAVWNRISNADTQEALILVSGITTALLAATFYKYRDPILSYISRRINEQPKVELSAAKKTIEQPETKVNVEGLNNNNNDDTVLVEARVSNMPTPQPITPPREKIDWGKAGRKVRDSVVGLSSKAYQQTSSVVLGVSRFTYRKSASLYHGTVALGPKIVRFTVDKAVGGSKLIAYLAVGGVTATYNTLIWAGDKYEKFAMGSYQLSEQAVIGSGYLAKRLAIGTYDISKGIVFWIGRKATASVLGIRNLTRSVGKYIDRKIENHRDAAKELDRINEFIKSGDDPKILHDTLYLLLDLYLGNKSLTNVRLRHRSVGTYLGNLIARWNTLVAEGKISLERSKPIFVVLSRAPSEFLRDSYIQTQLMNLVESLEASEKNGLEELRALSKTHWIVQFALGLNKLYSQKFGQLTLEERNEFVKLIEKHSMMKSQFRRINKELPDMIVEALPPDKITDDWSHVKEVAARTGFDTANLDVNAWSRLDATQKVKLDIFSNKGSKSDSVYQQYVMGFTSVHSLVESLRVNFSKLEDHVIYQLQKQILLNPKMINDFRDVELMYHSIYLKSNRVNWLFAEKAYGPGYLRVRELQQDQKVQTQNNKSEDYFQLLGETHHKLELAIKNKDPHSFLLAINEIDHSVRYQSRGFLQYEYTVENADWLFDKMVSDNTTTLEEFRILWRFLYLNEGGKKLDLRGQVIKWGKALKGQILERWQMVYKNHLSEGRFKSSLNPSKVVLSHVSTNAKNLRDMVGVIRSYNIWVYSSLEKDFHSYILERPELIQNLDDVKTLIDFEYFWPTASRRDASSLEEPLTGYFDKMRTDFPTVWKYEPSMVERTHHMIGNRLRQLGIYPKDFDGRLELFRLLTDRGVSSLSDELLHELLAESTPDVENKLRREFVEQGRIFEQALQEEFAVRAVKGEEAYKRLIAETDSQRRAKDLEEVVKLLQLRLPSGGLRYVEFLEELSVDILSSQEESAKIHKWKIFPSGIDSGKNDRTYSAINRVFNDIIKWKKKDQFEFLQFLRGDLDPSNLIRKSFPTIGPERIRRMYQSLPLAARMNILDLFMENGLLKGEKLNKGLGLEVVEHLIGQGDSESQQVARQLLVAFLYALKEVNGQNTALQKTILSYLYAMPKSKDNSIGYTLKHILEVFGATGIKVGQFLVAARILPPAETKILRDLQEKADIPLREDMYADAREILGSEELPFILKQLLGAASLKYAYLATEIKTQREVVIKVFRSGSINHVRTQFALLEKMTDYLIKNYGVKYGLFRSIVNSSRRAVEKETEISKESIKSKRARTLVYIDMDDPLTKVQVPMETLIKDRMLVSQFARGISFNDLPDKLKVIAAKKILEIENLILFGDKEEIEFDPDRHAGNYRIYFSVFDNRNYLVLEPLQENDETMELNPIDFGQFISIKKADREKVIKLFSLSQILTRLGVSASLEGQVSEIFDLDENQKKKLRKSLRRYFPNLDLKDVTPYFALLAAVEETGKVVDISYPDFIRAIVQLVQYEEFMPKGTQSPSLTLEREVRAQTQKYFKNNEVQLTTGQKSKIGAYNFLEKVKSTFTGKEYKPISLEIGDIEEFQITRETKPRPAGLHFKNLCGELF